MPDGPRRKTVSNAYLHRLQRRHFLLFDVLPIVGTVAAIAFLFVHPIGLTEVLLLVVMWAITGLGVTAGYHRLFTHRSYRADNWVVAMLAVAGSMAAQGPVVSWVALHRRHHELSDKDGDPHSPNLAGGGWRGRIRGLAHSHFLWMRRHDYPNIVHYAPDLLKNTTVMRISRHYHACVLVGLVVPAIVGGAVYGSWQGAVSGFLWGGAVRLFVLEHTVGAINSFLHMFGTKPYASRENSRNAGIFALVTFGESWHNNHHAFPESASFGLNWYRLDPGYWLIAALAAVGAVHHVGVPSEERRNAKRICTSAGASA